jgi:hypothetical protein
MHLGHQMGRLWPFCAVARIITICVNPARPNNAPTDPPHAPPHVPNLFTMRVHPAGSGDTVWVHLGCHMVRLWPYYAMEDIITMFCCPWDPLTPSLTHQTLQHSSLTCLQRVSTLLAPWDPSGCTNPLKYEQNPCIATTPCTWHTGCVNDHEMVRFVGRDI